MKTKSGWWILVGVAGLLSAGCQPTTKTTTEQQGSRRAPAELEVEQLAQSPADYAGQPLQLRGVVASAETGQQMFTVIDVAEYQSCRELGCAAYEIPVSFAGTLPETARVVRITGRLEQPEPGRFLLRAQSVESLP